MQLCESPCKIRQLKGHQVLDLGCNNVTNRIEQIHDTETKCGVRPSNDAENSRCHLDIVIGTAIPFVKDLLDDRRVKQLKVRVTTNFSTSGLTLSRRALGNPMHRRGAIDPVHVGQKAADQCEKAIHAFRVGGKGNLAVQYLVLGLLARFASVLVRVNATARKFLAVSLRIANSLLLGRG